MFGSDNHLLCYQISRVETNPKLFDHPYISIHSKSSHKLFGALSRVIDEFMQEALLLVVDGVDDEAEKLVDLSLEGKGLGLGLGLHNRELGKRENPGKK